MKLNDLRKIIREEVTKVVRAELIGFVKLLGETNSPPTKKRIVSKKKSKPKVTQKSLKEMIGDFEEDNFTETKEVTEQKFSTNPVLNEILNKTAQTPAPPGA